VSKPRAIAGLLGLPVYVGLVFALHLFGLLWALFCDLVPAGLEEIVSEWRKP